MAVGKNKRLTKSKKGAKKRLVDPFTRKEWYDIKAPSMFTVRTVGKTLATKTTGTKVSTESLKGRIVEASLGDLNKNEDDAYRKFQLRIEEVQGKNVLTNFYGMSFTTDKIRSLVRKWQSLIEANVDVTTTDGYKLRLFSIAFTRKRPNQIKKTCYAKSAQIKQIRAKMTEIMLRAGTNHDLKDLVKMFIPESLGKEIEKACQGIYPLQNVYIHKVKLLKSPKFDITKLMELYDGSAAIEETGMPVSAAPVVAVVGDEPVETEEKA